jgi:hypothetical protein
MKWYVIKNPHWKSKFELQVIKRGWGNGYVAIPPGHPAYKMDYDCLEFDLKVHGGITYADFGDGTNAPKDWWVFGFDTSHFGDSLSSWPEDKVIEETKELFIQLLEIEWGGL